jgi:aminobenzoyl-glutamate transport protein
MSETRGSFAEDGWLASVLARVERAGNALPHPATLFVLLSVTVMALSAVLSSMQVAVAHPLTGKAVAVVNLLSVEGMQRLMLNLVPNFTGFGPMGPLLVSLLGLSVAERSGLLGATVRLIIGAAHGRGLTWGVVCAGAMSHTAGDVGYVLLLPLSASLFHAAGRHPLAGLAAAFAGVSGGFAANLLLSPTDFTLAGITQDAARMIYPEYAVTGVASYFFLAASVPLVTVTGAMVTERMVEPRLGRYTGAVVADAAAPLSTLERRGLRAALLATLVLVALVVAGLWPADGVLRDRTSPDLVHSVFLRGLVFFLFVFGLIPGCVYGRVVGTVRRDTDVYAAMQDTMALVSGYLVVVFFIAQFVALFAWSNLGVVTAVAGAGWLKGLGLGPIPLLIGLMLLTCVIDLFLGSASAKWALLGPVLVPMFMLLGYSPELTQTAYRVGDSLTNIITPLSSNFPLVLMFLQRYEPKAGIGTLTAMMLPYTLVNLVAWMLMLVLWVWLGWPTGPGAPLFLPVVGMVSVPAV